MKSTFFGVFAFVPMAVIVLGIFTVIGVVDHAWADVLFRTQAVFVPAAIFFAVALLLYLIDIWRNPRVPKVKRALWTVVLFAANWYALPFYFWFYVRERP